MIPLQTTPALNGAQKKKSKTIADATRGKQQTPWYILLYGEPKVGKSTFASGSPSPIWIDLDNGSVDLDVARYPKPETFAELREAINDIAKNGKANGYQTLVIDPISHIEPLITLDITNGEIVNTKTWGGGYGAYDNAVRDRIHLFFSDIERAWCAGLNVMLIGHSRTKRFDDPAGPSYDRYELDVEAKSLAGLAVKNTKAILFARREVFGRQHDKAENKRIRAAGSGEHMLYTAATPGFLAGNRWNLPPEMPLSWPVFAAELARGPEREAELRAQIESGLTEINDPAVSEKVKKMLADGAVVADVANAVRVKLAENKGEKS